MKRIIIFSTLLSGAFLAGCANVSAPSQQQAGYQVETAPKRQAQLAEVTSWNASGALSVQQPGQSPMIMRYDWEQRGPNNYRVDLSGSLNMGSAVIVGQPGKVTLQKGNQPPVSAPTAEELMRKNLGWTLPIPSLWYWARGLPAPGATQETKYDTYGHLTLLRQNGWQLHYSDYKTVQGVDLPQVIQINNGRLSARLVVKQWHLQKR